MKIDKIVLHNFRIYNGINEIDFHENNEGNISLIAGKNGFGKTTFLTSLIWGLYGNQMSQVEDKYKRDIKNAGGYEKYLQSQLNRGVLRKFDSGDIKNARFSVEIHLIDVLIPSIPCKSVIVKRSYDYAIGEEKLVILIDNDENELTQEVGYEVFINDFILPREIAKFFFFDAEKIVTLAEAKSKAELRSLSKAYSEVLGIKKYEDLKQNLKSLLTKLRRGGVEKVEQDKLNELIKIEKDLIGLIDLNKEKQFDVKNEISQLKQKIELIQEKLIREGNEITLEELIAFKKERDDLKIRHKEVKEELKKLFDVIPFVIANKQFNKLITQLRLESDSKSQRISKASLDKSLKDYKDSVLKDLKTLKVSADILKGIKTSFNERAKEILDTNGDNYGKILLDFDNEMSRKIFALNDNISSSFKSQFNEIVRNEKVVRAGLNNVLKKIKRAEARKDNPLAIKLRQDKQEVSENLDRANEKLSILVEEYGGLNAHFSSNKKILSEYEKNFKLVKTDKKKYEVTLNLLEKLEILTERIKQEKKYSLQKAILLGLKKLMHKNNFINKVDVIIENDVMDIDLIDSDGTVIEKDTLSKGEQQLYATSLLKALVDESGINFPVFIDSPLQKFDKQHSSNVIQQFYPSISDQVVLFPLLEKELSHSEYEQLKPFLNGTYLITNTGKGSSVIDCAPEELFEKFNEQNYVLTD